MENFFNSLFAGENDSFVDFARNAFVDPDNPINQYAQAAFDPQGDGPKGPPPASKKALRQLPCVSVAPEDLVDENNRECCICLEGNHLKDRVVRLPCAHIFHQKCIMDWLTKHGTCPVCRYELETDDPQYEKQRRKRMANRKPRIHTYELDRMSGKQLRELGKQLRVRFPFIVREKRDLIQALVKSGKIEIIAAPKPVEQKLSDLRQMGAGKLKRFMTEAGVFFDPIDVVEKEDMVQIFCNSGRLVILPEEETEEEEEPTKMSTDLDPIDTTKQPHGGQNYWKLPVVETVSEDDLRRQDQDADEDACIMFLDTDMEVETQQPLFGVREEETEINIGVERTEDANGGDDMETEVLNNDGQETTNNLVAEEHNGGSSSHNDARLRFQNHSIAALRSSARRLNVNISDCIERSEMVERLAAATVICPEVLEPWSESTLRALAASVDVDFSGCADRSDMVNCLIRESKRRPFVNAYLGAFIPLATMSVSELRRHAQQWNVNVSDCLEKGEIIQRLCDALS